MDLTGKHKDIRKVGCMILYMSIAFWYLTLSGNIIHFNSVKSSTDGVFNGLSKIDLAARF